MHTVTAREVNGTDNRATARTVVLLRATDREKLESLAAQEKVSAGDIIRRSLDSYESLEARIRREEEEKMFQAAISLVDDPLRGVNESIASTLAKLDRLHAELERLDIR